MKHVRSTLFILLAVIVCSDRSCVADGGFFIRTKELGTAGRGASSPKQEAMLIADGERVQVILRSSFAAGPTDVAWVVPVPAKPEGIQAVDDTVFTAMEEIAAPRFYEMTYHGRSGWQCGCSAGEAMRSDHAALPPVVLHEVGQAGMYDFVVLSARDGQSLARWLNSHEYHLPDASAPVLERYAQMNWYWLAMRLRPRPVPKEAIAAPHPITYNYTSSKLVFPLVISQVSAAPENEIVLHVVARDRYGCANFRTATIGPARVTRSAGTLSGTNYERLFEAEMASAGGAFVTEHAMPWSESEVNARREALKAVSLSVGTGARPMVVTRLRAVIKPAAMDRDVELVPVADAWVSNHIYIQENARSSSGNAGGIAVMLAMLMAAATIRSEQRFARITAAGALILMCLL